MNDWEGKERRRDYPELHQKLIKIDLLEERVNNWLETTKEYRKIQCDKMDEIRQDIGKLVLKVDVFEGSTNQLSMNVVKLIADLPCKTQEAASKSMGRQVGFMWVVLSGMCLTLFLIVLKAFAK